MALDLAGRGQELIADGVPFVEATVVRAQVPAPARAGDGALVLPDGSIEGFVGGQCARGSVREAALAAIRDRSSVLLRVVPEDGGAFPDTPGARVVVNPCLSGGALEIFLRPRLPDPVIAVVGDSPIAAALEELGPPLGFVVDRGGEPSGATAVVVAVHGGDEAGAVRAALDAGVGYVGLVASPRRAASVLGPLALTEQERERVSSPAGLDIGAAGAPEIALSILAELVRAVRREGLPVPLGRPTGGGSRTDAAVGPEPPGPATAVDPVCGMAVTVDTGTPHLVVDGTDVWFCCPGCRDRHADASGQGGSSEHARRGADQAPGADVPSVGAGRSGVITVPEVLAGVPGRMSPEEELGEPEPGGCCAGAGNPDEHGSST
ncbi:XdhC family protein [Nocardiopsis sp. HNM0947]|uniref:XdhC family protein n=1 Tax=Nocardiopsis coralli TaxID=2772213 RepID=A0ABR9P4F8_9ACTN|nr:XdhC family protein [Nocardiopsis coralli]MBE2998610.1 XdhC family protein [Nocardiopsis coralli]